MKLISYQHNGTDSYGAVVGDRVVDLRRAFGERAADLKALIAAGLLGEAAGSSPPPPSPGRSSTRSGCCR